MNKINRWIVAALAVCCLLLGLPNSAAMQDQKAQLAEALRLGQQASQLRQAGHYAEAIPLAERTLSITEKTLGPEHFSIAGPLNLLASLYKAQGDYERAALLYKRALAIAEKGLGLEHTAVAVSLNNLGALYEVQGDYGRAVPLLQRALAIYEKALGPKHPDVAGALNNLAMLYKALGDYGRAAPLLQRALAIFEKALGPEHPKVTAALSNLAGLYKALGDYERAVPLYERALAVRQKELGPEHPDVADSFNNLAMLYKAQGDYERATPLFQSALAIAEKKLGPEHPDVARSLNNLAGLYYDQGDNGRAIPLLQRASAIFEKALGPEHPNVTELLSNLAGVYQSQGDYVQAVSLLERSENMQERHLALILNIGSQQQKQLYLNTLLGGTYVSVWLHAQSVPQNADAARLALTMILRRKGRALDASTNQIAALRSRAMPEDQHLLEQLGTIQSRLANLQLSGTGNLSPEEQQAEVVRLAAEREQLEDKISRRSAEFRATVQPITFNAVRQAVPAAAALVESFVYYPYNAKATTLAERFGAPRYVTYVLHRADDAPQFTDLGEAALIDAEVERLREALKNSNRTDAQVIARAVDERVMQPVRKLLGQTQRILLSPDGALNLIPFAALVDEDGKYLAENYSFTYLTSGRDLLRLQAQTESRNVPMVLANPLYDLPANQHANSSSTRSDENPRSLDFRLLNYKPLPGTAEEAAALGKLWPDAQVLTQDKATESALKQVHSPRILHVATHGFFLADQPRDLPAGNTLRRETIDTFDSPSLSNPSPLPTRWENPLLRSGLVLAGVNQQQSGAGEDGVLTALETAGLDLWGTKLVVLSACETGLGEVQNGAGVYGLRRALVLAGSQTQVMSLWKVSDAGTRDLMSAYYAHLQAGEGRTEALRQVQLAMLRGELKSTQDATDYRHPYYWAAFIPSGDWRSMDGKEDGFESRSYLRSPAVLSLAIIGFIALLLFWARRRMV